MTGLRVALVDSGGTNIGSVSYALERLGATAVLTSDPATMLAADRVILPGVGAAGEGMRRLRDAGLLQVLAEVEAPLLGVCLGMQLLFDSSEEDGGVECLGFVPGAVVAIPPSPAARVPHMGWNALELLRDDPLLRGITTGERAYFVHSFAAPVGASTLAASTHGGPWSAVVRHGHHWGAQFHPERSADVGARLLTNFLEEVSDD